MITKVIFSILARAVHEQWLHDFSLFSDKTGDIKAGLLAIFLTSGKKLNLIIETSSINECKDIEELSASTLTHTTKWLTLQISIDQITS
ncbi:MAG: hypothetical protein JRJ37_09845 [Deltaproteobacteria bacterium]|nr:hypothetical protein [Deltaproteobacteria bacterium]